MKKLPDISSLSPREKAVLALGHTHVVQLKSGTEFDESCRELGKLIATIMDQSATPPLPDLVHSYLSGAITADDLERGITDDGEDREAVCVWLMQNIINAANVKQGERFLGLVFEMFR